VPYLLHAATVRPVQLPSFIVNGVILAYSAALAIYYLLIKKETRIILTRVRLFSPAKNIARGGKLRTSPHHAHTR
ncbi:MAG TPA: hypothetical protein VKB35_04500, partial [Ktedonobacteraceae bacterium]|nr:hypothetical protein [Ktedonobacteraceae bacterium]